MSFVPYVPRLALRLLRDISLPVQQPHVVPIDASVLLADVSGFTAIVDRLLRTHGDRGAERLQEIVNQCFGPLTDIVESAGGEVLSFPGDAALALWSTLDTDVSPAEVTAACAACGLELLRKLDGLAAVADVQLRFRIAIGAGRTWAALLGGVNGAWQTVLYGDAIGQLSGALQAALPGEVVLSPAARECLGKQADTEPRGTQFALRSLNVPAAPVTRSVGMSDIVDAYVRSLVPRSVVARIEAGHRGWLAEFRTVTVLFIRLTRLGDADHDAMQRFVEVTQTLVDRFEGAVNQIVVDESGPAAVLVFGAMERAHEDDAIRAVRTAMAIHGELRDAGVESHAGLSTGRVFAGSRGGVARLEFALVGATVVLAARLAALADDVLCDRATRTACRRGVHFESLPARTVKGKPDLIEVWRPRIGTVVEGELGLVGREAELRMLEERVLALERDGRGGFVVIEGEPGIGKSALIDDLVRRAQSRAVRALTGKADSIEQRTPYLAWRSVAAAILGPDAVRAQDAAAARLIELVGPDKAPWLPLLRAVLPWPIPENDHTRNMDPEGRARTTRDLIVALLSSAARTTPLLVVLEDTHWMDSASWEIADQAVAQIPRLLLLVTTRRQTFSAEGLTRLSQRPDASRIVVGPLGLGEMRHVIAQRLAVDDVPEELALLINERAEGHPLFAIELAIAMRNRAAIVIEGGSCRIAAAHADLEAQPFPTTVQGVVATRIDQLTPQEQLTMKVASVLGREFTVADLVHVHPVATHDDQLQQEVDAIARSGLFHLVREGTPAIAFSHAVVQEVAYDLLPFSQRRDLHRRAAEWIEQRHGGDLDNVAALLAHHWESAEATDKAIFYLDKAGARALLRDSADRDAEDFLTRLLILARTNPVAHEDDTVTAPMIGRIGTHTIRLARWERLLAQALARQGRHAEGLEHLHRGLALLGQRLSTTAIGFELAWHVTARLARRPRSRLDPCPSAVARFALTELALTYEKLVEFLYLGRRDTAQSLACTIRAVRAAEFAGPSPVLSRMYSFFANLAAMFNRHPLADDYAEKGRAIAVEIGDDTALFRALTIGHLPSFIRGEWEKTAAAFERARTLADTLKIVQDGLIFEYALARVYFNQGRLEEARAYLEAIARHAAAKGSQLTQGWATVSIGEVDLRQGRLDQAIVRADEALALADSTHAVDQNSRFQAHGVLASAWLRKGEPGRAQQHIAPAVAAANGGAKLSYSAQAGFTGVAAALLATAAQDERARAQLRQWLRLLRLMAWCRPILEPWDLVFRAAWNLQLDRRMFAVRQLRRAIRRADSMSLPYESAFARAELARALAPADPGRHALLEEACAGFERIGALADFADVRAVQAGDAAARHARSSARRSDVRAS